MTILLKICLLLSQKTGNFYFFHHASEILSNTLFIQLFLSNGSNLKVNLKQI